MTSKNPEIVGPENPADALGEVAGLAESTGADGRGEGVAVVFRRQGKQRARVSPEASAASSAENGQQETSDTPGAQALGIDATPSDEEQRSETVMALAGGVTLETPSSEAAHTTAEDSATTNRAITAATTEPSAKEPASEGGAPEDPGNARSHHAATRARHGARLSWTGQACLLFSLVSGALTHGWHLFQYPLYITDEGIYMEQAWSVLREGQLAPYTYVYDHAPAGWLLISGWASLLPFQFQTFGNAINTGRVLMLILHLLSVFLLFQVTYRFSGRLSAPVIACFFFNVSPLAVYYQRQVLLDNIMVFWVLLCLYLIQRNDGRILTAMYIGVACGIGVLTKENAIFFVPVIAYLFYTQVRQQQNYRFVLGFWTYMCAAVISVYFLYATTKNELWPTGLNFNLQTPPTDHVSLLYTIWWQLHRGGAVFSMPIACSGASLAASGCRRIGLSSLWGRWPSWAIW